MIKTLVIKDDLFFFFGNSTHYFFFFLNLHRKKENLWSVIYDIQSPCPVCRKLWEPKQEELEIGSCAYVLM